MEFVMKNNVTSELRKSAVKTVSEFTGLPSSFKFAPTFEYVIGGYTVSRYGSVIVADDADRSELTALFGKLAERGLEYEYPAEFAAIAATPSGSVWELPGKSVIEVPLAGFSAAALDNLERLIEGKSALIKKALGADALPIERTADTLRFPWFSWDMDGATAKACATFVAKLCELAKTQKRITVRETVMSEDDSEKFTFRCFLLRLGFIGREYAADRKVLLSKLSGSSAFKRGDGRANEAADCGGNQYDGDVKKYEQ
jgi:hypothetical protein